MDWVGKDEISSISIRLKVYISCAFQTWQEIRLVILCLFTRHNICFYCRVMFQAVIEGVTPEVVSCVLEFIYKDTFMEGAKSLELLAAADRSVLYWIYLLWLSENFMHARQNFRLSCAWTRSTPCNTLIFFLWPKRLNGVWLFRVAVIKDMRM